MPFGSGLGESELTAIDITIRATGQQGLQDMQARVGTLRNQIDLLSNSMAVMGRASQADIDQLAHLSAQLTKAEAVVRSAKQALGGLPAGVALSQQAFLQLSYAIDDIQYGFNAIVNNVPQIALAMGLGPGVAGAVGIATVALNVFAKESIPTAINYFKEFAKARDWIRDPIRDATDALEGMKEKIKALEDKPLKFERDYEALRTYTVEVKLAERALREFEALKNKRSEAEQAAFESVQKGVQEGGGGRNLEDALIEVAKRSGSYGAGSQIPGQIEFYRVAQSKANDAMAAVGGAGSSMAAPFIAAQAYAIGKINELQHQMDLEQREKVAGLVTLKGGEASRKTLEGILDNPAYADIFQRNQIDLDRLGAGVAGAAPDRLFQKDRDRIKKEEQQKTNERIRQDNQSEQASIDEGQRQAQEKERAANQDADRAGRDKDKMDRDAQQLRDKAKADQLRAEREAPGIARNARIGGYAQDFQAMTGATNNEAMEAGKRINALAEKGVEPTKAAHQVYQEMMRAILKIQVNQDMMLNINSGAIDQLQALDAMANATRQRIRGVQGNQKRGRQRGITLGMTQN